jgi:hypothetical protein
MPNVQRRKMRKQCLRILIALIGVAGFGISAKAQGQDQVVVNVPYEFVAAGKTLPAGTYRVVRLSINNPRALILNSLETRASALVFATQVENSHSDKPKVSFEQVGGEYALSKIETGNRLFKIPISRLEILDAAARSHNGTSASESSAGTN